jgi:plastocyanin
MNFITFGRHRRRWRFSVRPVITPKARATHLVCLGRAWFHLIYLSAFLFPSLFFTLAAKAAEVFVDIGSGVRPEVICIERGDTVVWRAGRLADVESYTGEWKSPVLEPGQTFEHNFSKPGFYAFRSSSYTGNLAAPVFLRYFPGVIRVNDWTNSRPAISIVTPIDGFVVGGLTLIRAVTTNAMADVKAVEFYNYDSLIGSATNAPYEILFRHGPDPHQFTARLIDSAGETKVSAPVRVTVELQYLFNPRRLPGGQFLFHYSIISWPTCVQWSDDLKTWRSLRLQQVDGFSTLVDEYETNAPMRFYRVRPCL